MTSNIQKLGQEIFGQMGRVTNANSSIAIELASIVKGLALQPDFSPGPIPKGEYMVTRHLTLGKKDDVFGKTSTDAHRHSGGGHSQYTGTGVHTHSDGEHNHDLLVPELLRSLKVGDRVLIAWTGTEPVVIDIVENS